MSIDAQEPPEPDRARGILDRARRVLLQHLQLGAVPAAFHDDGAYPHYAERGGGATFRDVNGREYVDWFLGGGPLLLGHAHPAIRAALIEQIERGPHMSLPTPIEIDVAEMLCALYPSAEQVVFAKNGTDVTSAAVRLARAATGRETVLMCGYHGFQDWSAAADPQALGIPAAMKSSVATFGYGDRERLAELLIEHDGRVAAIILEPIRYGPLDVAFLRDARSLADHHGVVLVFDEIVTGFRVDRSGVQALTGVVPDLTCLAKALANGLPLAALVGRRQILRHLPALKFGMTYRRDALSLAAARAALEVYQSVDVPAHVARVGDRLRAGFDAAAMDLDLAWRLDGHPSMLHLDFEGGGRLRPAGALTLFVEQCQRRGVYVSPRRLFSSIAHGDAEVDRTIAVMADALAVVRHAMDVGLERLLDSPLQPDMQTAAPVPADDAAWASEAVGPNPFAIPLGAAVDPIRESRFPADERSRITPDEHGVSIAIDAVDRGGHAAGGVQFAQTAADDYRVEVDYHVEAWLPRNEIASAVLAIGQGDHWARVQHDIAFGRFNYARAAFGLATAEQICAYGARAGTLGFQRRGDSARAWLIVAGEALQLGEVSGLPSGRTTLLFRFAIRGECRGFSARIDAVRMTIDEVGA